MEVGLVKKIDIDAEMQQSYLDYAMSVIVSRALPDARDGLKPVHRRILYAMFDMGVRPSTTYRKSARIVGEVLGKYHPHGDAAVYEAMARMAQDFSMRCLMVDGQGNFGSIDGDPPAAMRYTEARMADAAGDLLADIKKDTVDFDTNFDGTLTEPTVLPAALPNLLVNGATGIAVGMSTSIPPHNLGEVVDALKFMLQKWDKLDDINIEDLMGFIQGPDFPTGGIIIQSKENETLSGAYGSGRGRVTVQARVHMEEMGRGRNRIIVTELPYMTNKAALIEKIADLARNERITGIADLRDESDRQGMRIVIELSKTADPQGVLGDLYRLTPMQNTFSIIMLALVGGEPRMLTLKQALRVYLDHRLEIVKRRSEFDLKNARERAHILEGLQTALDNLDDIIALIRRSPDADKAKERLQRRFKLSEIQAQAILDMQLRRLAALERKKINDEYREIKAKIKFLEGLLRSPKKMRQVVADELEEVKEKYDDRRRTQIALIDADQPKAMPLTMRDLIEDKTVWLTITEDGLVALTSDDKLPRQSGSEAPTWLLKVNTRDTLFLAAENGMTAAIPVHNVPEANKPSAGIHIEKISPLSLDDHLACTITLPPKDERAEERYLFSVSQLGMVKKSAIADLPGPTADLFTMVRINEGDRLQGVFLTDGKSEILMMAASGMAIRFSEEDVRPMGLVAAGVMGMKLKDDDHIIGAEIFPTRGEVFIIGSLGTAKRVVTTQFPKQGRYGQGVVAWKPEKNEKTIGMTINKGTARVTLHLWKLAPKMTRLDAAPLQGRAARGKTILDLKAGDEILQMTTAVEIDRPVAKRTNSTAKSKRISPARKRKAKK